MRKQGILILYSSVLTLSHQTMINLKTKIMKKISKFGLMLTLTLVTMNMSAGIINLTSDAKKEQAKTVTFTLDQLNDVDLSISDEQGIIIYAEKADSQKAINRSFDLKALPQGVYFLDTESDTKISRYEISVSKKTASISKNAISESYKPLFLIREGKVKLSFFNLDKSPVTIKIFDKDSNEVYDSKIIKDQHISQVFDINKVNDQEYTFVMTNKDNVYTKKFANR